MIIDSHYHLETRLQPVDELLASMDKHSISRTALIPTMVEPFQIGERGKRAGDIMRNALMGNFNFMGRFAYRTTVDSKGNFVLLTQRFRIFDTPDNGEVARVVERYPERFVAWVFVNPAVEDAVREARVWMERPGAIGVKAHPFWHRYHVHKLDDTAHLCMQNEWPMLIHLGGDRKRGDYKFLPDRHPRLRVVYAHAGVPFYKELWDYAKKKDNVFVDISSPYINEEVANRAVAALGPDKILFGTDGPYGFTDDNGKYDHSVILGWIDRMRLKSADKEKILGGNFKSIARK